MQDISFFSFCRSLLIDPVGFLNSYFQGDHARPPLKAYLEKVLYGLVLVIMVVKSFYTETEGLAFLYRMHDEAMILFTFGLLQALVVLALGCLLLPLVYRLSYRCFQEAVYWSGGMISAEKGKELALYLTGYGIVLDRCGDFFAMMKRLSMDWLGSQLLVDFFSLGQVLSLIFILVFYLYYSYKIIKKMTNARAWLVMILWPVFIIFGIIALTLALSLLVLMLFMLFGIR